MSNYMGFGDTYGSLDGKSKKGSHQYVVEGLNVADPGKRKGCAGHRRVHHSKFGHRTNLHTGQPSVHWYCWTAKALPVQSWLVIYQGRYTVPVRYGITVRFRCGVRGKAERTFLFKKRHRHWKSKGIPSMPKQMPIFLWQFTRHTRKQRTLSRRKQRALSQSRCHRRKKQNWSRT